MSSCGFTSFVKDDMPSWTGPTYIPRIKNMYGNDAKKMPFDFPEVVGALAPRPFLACAAIHDDDVIGFTGCIRCVRRPARRATDGDRVRRRTYVEPGQA